MRKLLFFLAAICYAQTPAVNFGLGPTITWYSDSALTHPWAQPNGMIQETQEMWGKLSAPGTVTCYGTCQNGSLTTINSTTVKFTANFIITACSTVDGLQVLPCDDVFFADISTMPQISTHYVYDGANVCGEATGTPTYIPCGGNPLLGTGQYEYVEPATTDPNYTQCIVGGALITPIPGSVLTTFSDRYCHVMGINGWSLAAAPVSNGTVLRNTELLTRPVRDDSTQAYTNYPEARPFTPAGLPNNMFYENRQLGTLRIPPLNCATKNSATYFSQPVPAFSNCTIGGTPPFAVSAGQDLHEAFVNPISYAYWENYNSTDRSGPNALQQCANSGGGVNCTTGSWKAINASNYFADKGIGLAGTPEYALELHGQELTKAALSGTPIGHMLVGPAPGSSVNFCSFSGSGAWQWPSTGPGGTTCNPPAVNVGAVLTNNIRGSRWVIGSRIRLSPTRTSTNYPIISQFKFTGVPSGYVPGTRIAFTVTAGCTDIVPGIHPSGIIQIGATGGIATLNGANYIWVTNTGQNCTGPFTITGLPASPGGGTNISILTTDVVTFNGTFGSGSVQEQNVAQALYDNSTKFGFMIDDIGGGGSAPQFRVDSYAYHSPWYPVVDQFFQTSNGPKGLLFGNSMLWESVDESSLLPQATGFPASSWLSSFSNMGAYWIADATVSAAHLTNQNMLKVTATAGGAIAYTPIPALGVGVGCAIGDLSLQLNIVSGMTPYTLPCYVTGDPSNSGFTASFVSGYDPCPGQDSIDATQRIYTACPAFDGIAPKVGYLRIASVVQPGTFAYLQVFVVPINATDNKIRFDTGATAPHSVTYPSGNPLGPVGGGTVTFANDITAQATTLPYTQGIVHSLQSIRTITSDGLWTYFNMNNGSGTNIHAPEVAIYRSSIYDTDITYTMVVPNGNYMVRDMYGESYNGTSTPTNQFTPYTSRSFTAIQTNEVVHNMGASQILRDGCDVRKACPNDLYTPVRVTNNELFYGKRGMLLNRFTGQTPFSCCGVNPQNSMINGLVISPDTTTVPHWRIGSFQRNNFETGNLFQVAYSDGVHTGTNPMGQPYPGVLQMFVRPYFTTGPIDPVWSVLNGIGTIDASTGLYQAPVAKTMANECAVVQAQSSSIPSVKATQKVCFTTTNLRNTFVSFR